jgi:hypothetical protein
MFVCTERLWLTVDDHIVPDGHREARFLFCTPGDEIPMTEAVRRNLVKPAKKQAATAANKQRGPAEGK